MGVYLRAKFEVSSTILMSSREGSNLTPSPPTSKRTPEEPTQIRFKEPFEWLHLDKQSLCLLSYYDLTPFQKRCHTYFLAEYLFSFICSMGTKVSSTFKTLSQKPIFNPVKHLGWTFSCENS